jgi:hypothetical protein
MEILFPFVPTKAGTQGNNQRLSFLMLDSRIGVRKHAVLRTAKRGNERSW